MVPPPHALFGSETREAFYELLLDIRRADTDRELMFLMERFLDAQREFRQFFGLVEAEQLNKLREFRENADRDLAERQAQVQHIPEVRHDGKT